MSMRKKLRKTDLDVTAFQCVRLKENPEHKTLIQGFNSNINGSIAWYLKHSAWREDAINYRAYYLVKDKNKIVLYFSLQSGMLVQCHKKTLNGIAHRESESEIEYYINEDKIDVTRVIPGIELVHFCVNDSYRRYKGTWKFTVGLRECTIGTYIFYKFIAPKIITVASITGLQYVYLFCADDGSNKLVEYYQNELHFSVMDDMACIRPKYDNGTTCCMTIKIDELVGDTRRFQDMEKVSSIIEYLQQNETISKQQAQKHFNIFDPSLLFAHIVEQGYGLISAKAFDGKLVRIKRSSKVYNSDL